MKGKRPDTHLAWAASGRLPTGCLGAPADASRTALPLILYVVFLLTLVVLFPGPSWAESEVHPETRYKEVQAELDQERERIATLLREETSLLTELDRIDRLLSEHREELVRLHKETRRLSAELEQTTKEIDNVATKLNNQTRLLRTRLRSLYRHYRNGDIAALISAEDYQKLIEEARLLGYLTYSDRLLIEGYRSLVTKLKSLQEELSKARSQVAWNTQQVTIRKIEIEKEKTNRRFLLSRVRESRSHSERLVRELEKVAQDLKEMIEKQAAETAILPPGTPFEKLQGRLPWPVRGRVVSRFGSQKDPLFDTPIFRNGIEIMAEENAAVKAVHQGVVAFAEWFKGFGQLIIINHGSGYHTLYSNLSQIFVMRGDPVQNGQMIARVAESDTYRASSLYFELRSKGKPVDPLKWLMR